MATILGIEYERGRCLQALMRALSCSVVSNSFATPWSFPGSSVHGIFQARIQEWVAMSSSKGSSMNPEMIRGPRHQGESTEGICCILNLQVLLIQQETCMIQQQRYIKGARKHDLFPKIFVQKVQTFQLLFLLAIWGELERELKGIKHKSKSLIS